MLMACYLSGGLAAQCQFACDTRLALCKIYIALSTPERQSDQNVMLHHWSMLGYVNALMSYPCHVEA